MIFFRFFLTLLAWNYTLEAFFWILVGAILVVTVTVLSANPELARELIKGPQRLLSLIGRSSDEDLSKDSLPDQIEKEDIPEETDVEEDIPEETDTEETVAEEIEQDELPLSARIKAYAIVLAYVVYVNFIEIVGFVFLLEGLPERLYDDFLNYPGGGGGLIFIIIGLATLLSGLISLYGYLANQNILLRNSCRATSVAFLLLIIFEPGWEDILGFVIIPLLFSGDLKQLWERILSKETDAEETDAEEIYDLSDMPVKGFWVRFVAFAIDFVIAAIWILGAFIFDAKIDIVDLVWLVGILYDNDNMGTWDLIVAGFSLVPVVFLLFKLMMDSSQFQGTLGKYIMNIKVVDENGQRITRSKGFLRTGVYSLMLFGSRYLDFGGLVGAFLIFGLLGFVMIGFTKKKQGLHDMICRTFVASSHRWQWEKTSSNLLSEEKKVKPLYDPHNRIEKEEKGK